ncbi:unnamed protein product [Gongylonema pulchrum]|uniref:ELM2 domain-containing protein n=1 Tax=Gongylonema pulchrum TaxID=637853 RepID=A0A183E792_9BILA|nr:unnamed protein product [Gongylonema pulchrum]
MAAASSSQPSICQHYFASRIPATSDSFDSEQANSPAVAQTGESAMQSAEEETKMVMSNGASGDNSMPCWASSVGFVDSSPAADTQADYCAASDSYNNAWNGNYISAYDADDTRSNSQKILAATDRVSHYEVNIALNSMGERSGGSEWEKEED